MPTKTPDVRLADIDPADLTIAEVIDHMRQGGFTLLKSSDVTDDPNVLAVLQPILHTRNWKSVLGMWLRRHETQLGITLAKLDTNDSEWTIAPLHNG